jgi:hypothetical protein
MEFQSELSATERARKSEGAQMGVINIVAEMRVFR